MSRNISNPQHLLYFYKLKLFAASSGFIDTTSSRQGRQLDLELELFEIRGGREAGGGRSGVNFLTMAI